MYDEHFFTINFFYDISTGTPQNVSTQICKFVSRNCDYNDKYLVPNAQFKADFKGQNVDTVAFLSQNPESFSHFCLTH